MTATIIIFVIAIILLGFFAWLPRSNWNKNRDRRRAEEVVDEEDREQFEEELASVTPIRRRVISKSCPKCYGSGRYLGCQCPRCFGTGKLSA